MRLDCEERTADTVSRSSRVRRKIRTVDYFGYPHGSVSRKEWSGVLDATGKSEETGRYSLCFTAFMSM